MAPVELATCTFEAVYITASTSPNAESAMHILKAVYVPKTRGANFREAAKSELGPVSSSKGRTRYYSALVAFSQPVICIQCTYESDRDKYVQKPDGADAKKGTTIQYAFWCTAFASTYFTGNLNKLATVLEPRDSSQDSYVICILPASYSLASICIVC
jgi:hypothetical protein